MIDSASLAAMVASFLTFGGMIYNGIMSYRREARNRQWAKEDREMAVAGRAAVAEKLDANTKTTNDALQAANHVNKKIASIAANANTAAIHANDDVITKLEELKAKHDATSALTECALQTANHTNDKIASLAASANTTAVASMEQVLTQLGDMKAKYAQSVAVQALDSVLREVAALKEEVKAQKK